MYVYVICLYIYLCVCGAYVPFQRRGHGPILYILINFMTVTKENDQSVGIIATAGRHIR